MTFNLRVPGDGSGVPSVQCRNHATGISTAHWTNPILNDIRLQEFIITPSYGTLRSQGLIDIEVQEPKMQFSQGEIGGGFPGKVWVS